MKRLEAFKSKLDEVKSRREPLARDRDQYLAMARDLDASIGKCDEEIQVLGRFIEEESLVSDVESPHVVVVPQKRRTRNNGRTIKSIIEDFVIDQSGTFTSAAVLAYVKSVDPTVVARTVYNTLSLLRKNGVIVSEHHGSFRLSLQPALKVAQ